MSKEILERDGQVFGVAVDQGSGLGQALRMLRGAKLKTAICWTSNALLWRP